MLAVQKCKESGVDGLIVVDLSFPDNKSFAKLCKRNSICFVQLIAPTTTIQRMKEIIKFSDSMIYMISTISTTGSALKYSAKKIIKNYKTIKKIKPSKNIVIGFGITDKTISNLKSADGLVVGSAICRQITRSLKHRHQNYEEFYVLDGELTDEDNTTFKKGEFISYKPGSKHSSFTKKGCLLLVFLRNKNKAI